MREGRDVTILCYSRMRYVVMQAVQQLEKQGFDPEARPVSRVQGSVRPCWGSRAPTLCPCLWKQPSSCQRTLSSARLLVRSASTLTACKHRGASLPPESHALEVRVLDGSRAYAAPGFSPEVSGGAWCQHAPKVGLSARGRAGDRPHLAEALRHEDDQRQRQEDGARDHCGGVHEDRRHRRLAVLGHQRVAVRLPGPPGAPQ